MKSQTFGVRGLIIIGAACVLNAVSSFAQDKLTTEFATPPDEARPHTWWHWMNGNISKEGITADLEAMKRVGIRGATIFNVDQQCPVGPVPFLSESWWNLTEFAGQEAKRLGLTLGTANCAGWSSSGGPWVTPDHAMKLVVVSEASIAGGGPVSIALAQPPTNLSYYRDIAVVAFPSLPAEKERMQKAEPKITASAPDFHGETLVDGNNKTGAGVLLPAVDKPQFIQFEFAEPYVIRSVSLLPSTDTDECSGEIQSSTDGVTYKTLAAFRVDRYLQPWEADALAWQRFGVPETTVRFYRIVFTKAGNRWPKLILREVDLSPRVLIDQPAAKTARQSYANTKRMWSSIPESEVINADQIVDLSDKMNAKGQLNWDAPTGEWTVLRVGYTVVDRKNHPAPAGGGGLEIDKLSREAARFHWSSYVDKLKQKFGPLWSPTVNEVLIDSYEVGMQNWTSSFRAEFRKRNGYDVVAYLPALTGRIVGSADQTERFLWDYRGTIAELMAENYYDYFSSMARQSGVKLASEPYGNGPFEDMRSGREAGIIMGEFWAPDLSLPKPNLRMIASTAHVYGKNIIGAEALTSRSKWADHPRYLKPCADIAYSDGINYFELHRYIHQPWTIMRGPGLSLGPFGSHMERTETWWEQSGGWIDYLARCQYLLRQGRFVADVLFFAGEGSLQAYTPTLPRVDGYNFDRINADALLTRLSAKDGSLVLPDGLSYRVLVLPQSTTMTPALLRKLKELVAGGATIVGPRPTQSPSLVGYPNSDTEVQQLAEELWGSGKIREVKSLQEVFGALKVAPDLEWSNKAIRLGWTHRANAREDIYFLCNVKDEWVQSDVTFRVAGKVPELWQADTGKRLRVPVYEEVDGRTRVSLRMEPFGSVFVVFRDAPVQREHIVSVTRTQGPGDLSATFPEARLLEPTPGKLELETWTSGQYVLKSSDSKSSRVEVTAVPPPMELTGPWELSFPPKQGAPDKVVLDKLVSWSDHPDSGVKYFSGTATYRKSFDVAEVQVGTGRRVYLDLGRVEVLAGVKLNGRDLGVVWKKPYVVDVTGVLKSGRNELELAATNLWPNRMIGDEFLPDDSPREKEWLKQWPQWVIDQKPSPTGRFTFTSWRFYKKDDPLLPSGVMGPVRVISSVVQAVSLP